MLQSLEDNDEIDDEAIYDYSAEELRLLNPKNAPGEMTEYVKSEDFVNECRKRYS